MACVGSCREIVTFGRLCMCRAGHGLLGMLYALNGCSPSGHGGRGTPSFTCGVPLDFSELTSSILRAQSLIQASGAPVGRGDVYTYVMVELLENLYRHGKAERADSAYLRRFSMWIHNGGTRCTFETANPVTSEEKQGLDAWLTHIDGLSQDESLSTYARVLQQEAHTKHNGAGAGLLTIRRKAKSLQWWFAPVEAGYHLFTLTVEM